MGSYSAAGPLMPGTPNVWAILWCAHALAPPSTKTLTTDGSPPLATSSPAPLKVVHLLQPRPLWPAFPCLPGLCTDAAAILPFREAPTMHVHMKQEY